MNVSTENVVTVKRNWLDPRQFQNTMFVPNIATIIRYERAPVVTMQNHLEQGYRAFRQYQKTLWSQQDTFIVDGERVLLGVPGTIATAKYFKLWLSGTPTRYEAELLALKLLEDGTSEILRNNNTVYGIPYYTNVLPPRADTRTYQIKIPWKLHSKGYPSPFEIMEQLELQHPEFNSVDEVVCDIRLLGSQLVYKIPDWIANREDSTEDTQAFYEKIALLDDTQNAPEFYVVNPGGYSYTSLVSASNRLSLLADSLGVYSRGLAENLKIVRVTSTEIINEHVVATHQELEFQVMTVAKNPNAGREGQNLAGWVLVNVGKLYNPFNTHEILKNADYSQFEADINAFDNEGDNDGRLPQPLPEELF